MKLRRPFTLLCSLMYAALLGTLGCTENKGPQPAADVGSQTVNHASDDLALIRPPEDRAETPAVGNDAVGNDAVGNDAVGNDAVGNDAPGNDAPDEATPSETSTELDLVGITFLVPTGWQKVTPKIRIIEAEYALPRAEGDDSDGRLTIMSAGGGRQDNIDRWIGQFNSEPGEQPKTETLMIGGKEATLVDIRGTFKGQGGPFTRSQPKPNHRMLAVIIPFGAQHSYFVKLTGPKATIGKHEPAFREFVKTGKFRP